MPCRDFKGYHQKFIDNKCGEADRHHMWSINSDKDLDKLHERMVEEQITWRSWWDGGGTSGPIASTYGVRAWPTTYVLDHKGVIRFKDVRDKDLDEAVDKLLAELEAEKKKP